MTHNHILGACLKEDSYRFIQEPGKVNYSCPCLAVRAAGAGLKVFICQFLKRGKYSEIKAMKHFSSLIKVEQYGAPGFIIKRLGWKTENGQSAVSEGLTKLLTQDFTMCLSR